MKLLKGYVKYILKNIIKTKDEELLFKIAQNLLYGGVLSKFWNNLKPTEQERMLNSVLAIISKHNQSDSILLAPVISNTSESKSKNDSTVYHPIPGYDGYAISKEGVVINTSSDTILKYYPYNNSIGCTINGKACGVAKLVAITFLELSINNRAQIIFKDNNRNNVSMNNISYKYYNATSKNAKSPVDISEFTPIPGYNNYIINPAGVVYNVLRKKIVPTSKYPSGGVYAILFVQRKRKRVSIKKLIKITFGIKNYPQINKITQVITQPSVIVDEHLSKQIYTLKTLGFSYSEIIHKLNLEMSFKDVKSIYNTYKISK